MLVDPPIEELLPYVDNRYVLAMITAKRARQLIDGAQPMTEESEDLTNVVTQAAKELTKHTLKILIGKHEVTVPLRPEVEAARLEAEILAKQKREEALLEENKRQDNSNNSVREQLEREAAMADASSQDSAREFTEQLIRLIGRHSEESEALAEAEATGNAVPEEEPELEALDSAADEKMEI